VVLHQVLECADLVVVAGASLEREGLVPDDVDLLDVLAGPDRVEHAVGQTRCEHVLDAGHGQEVVDAKDVTLVEPFGEEAVESHRAVEVIPERLLEHHLALCGKPRFVER